jgi:hypothetical protein
MDEAKKLSYPERVKLSKEWGHYCKVVNNQKPAFVQFVAWLQDVKGLRLTPAKQTVIAAGD